MATTVRQAVLVLVVLTCSLIPLTATGEPITYTESFTAMGTVNGTPFDGNVQFILSSDTTLVFGNCSGFSGIFCTPNGTAHFSIQGIGAGTFTDHFFAFDNQNGVAVAGFTDIAIEDIVDLSNPAFATYNLKSAIGPLTSSYFFVLTSEALGSTLGNVIINSASGTPKPTFGATTGGTTPEPSSILLFGSGLVGIATMLRRKLRI